MYKKLYSKFALAKSISQAEEVYNWSDYITDEQREELDKLIKDGKEIYETSDLALHHEIAENLEKLLSEILG